MCCSPLLWPSRSLRMTQSSRAPYGANITVNSLSPIVFGSIPTKRRLSSSKENKESTKAATDINRLGIQGGLCGATCSHCHQTERAFSIVGPSVWNSLPSDLRSLPRDLSSSFY